jgi:beta-lactamase superfamily II metal-dependent hydrolase
MMEYGEKRFLFCGDAMEQRLNEFIDDSPGKVDYVKLPYHGNYLENYTELLDAISPEYGVICCSDKNPPNDETLALLSQYGVKVYETRNGAVSLKTNGKAVKLYQ